MSYEINLPVSEDFQTNDGILFIESSAKPSHKDALELLAGYFKKEFKYDYLQYERYGDNNDCVGILFVERARDLIEHENHHPHRVIGGACFRKKSDGSYVLDWVWFHPFARNRKNLKKHWELFKQRFGNFKVTEPLSAQMEQFLVKNA